MTSSRMNREMEELLLNFSNQSNTTEIVPRISKIKSKAMPKESKRSQSESQEYEH